MPIIPGQPGLAPIPPAPNTVRNVCTNALYELNVVAPGENPEAQELAFVLSKFNQMLDSWTAKKVYIYAYVLQSFNLTPGLQPHTIGPAQIAPAPAPTFLLANNAPRPPRIEHINVLLNNVSPVVRISLNKRDKDWWANNTVQGIPSQIPVDFYYRPDWPAGSIFLWPVPNHAYGLEVEIEGLLQGAANLDTVFAFPQGYELAVTLTLAELCSIPFEKPPNQMLIGAAAQARAAVAGLNAQPPRISLDDFGSSSGKPIPTFNYRSGLQNP
jgi:hypothetical protein